MGLNFEPLPLPSLLSSSFLSSSDLGPSLDGTRGGVGMDYPLVLTQEGSWTPEVVLCVRR